MQMLGGTRILLWHRIWFENSAGAWRYWNFVMRHHPLLLSKGEDSGAGSLCSSLSTHYCLGSSCKKAVRHSNFLDLNLIFLTILTCPCMFLNKCAWFRKSILLWSYQCICGHGSRQNTLLNEENSDSGVRNQVHLCKLNNQVVVSNFQMSGALAA